MEKQLESSQSILENEIINLHKKMAKMQSQINGLVSENLFLKEKVISLETVVANLYAHSNIALPNEISISQCPSRALDIQWLYHIFPKEDYSQDKILTLLKIDESKEVTYVEIKANWSNENEMYIKILQHFEQFNEFQTNFQEMKPIKLNKIFQEIFKIVLLYDLVIFIKEIPSSQHNNQSYKTVISNIGSLTGAIYQCYKNLLSHKENIGNIALILESENNINELNIYTQTQNFLINIKPLQST